MEAEEAADFGKNETMAEPQKVIPLPPTDNTSTMGNETPFEEDEDLNSSHIPLEQAGRIPMIDIPNVPGIYVQWVDDWVISCSIIIVVNYFIHL